VLDNGYEKPAGYGVRVSWVWVRVQAWIPFVKPIPADVGKALL